MDYNSDRLAILSGVISRDEYTDKLLVEDRRARRGHRRLNEMEATVVLSPETPEELAAVDDLALDPEAVDVEPSPEATMTTASAPEEAMPEETLPAPDAEALPEEEPLPEPMTPEEEELEERLRRAIRHEVQSVLAEVQAKQEEAQLERGRRMKSVESRSVPRSARRTRLDRRRRLAEENVSRARPTPTRSIRARSRTSPRERFD